MATYREPTETSAPPGHDPAVELLPRVDESPAAYLARLKALHRRVGALIDAIETRRPVLGPVPPRPERSGAERRAGEERRGSPGERRTGMPESRSLPVERRTGPRDRRSLPVERREEHITRRRDPEPVPWNPDGFRLDGTAVMWALQFAAWVLIVTIALVYGIG